MPGRNGLHDGVIHGCSRDGKRLNASVIHWASRADPVAG